MDTIAPVWSWLGGSGLEEPWTFHLLQCWCVLSALGCRTSHLLVNLTDWRTSKHLEPPPLQENSFEEHLLLASEKSRASEENKTFLVPGSLLVRDLRLPNKYPLFVRRDG